MNNLYRDLAPVTEEAWAEIERLKPRYNPAFPGRETPPAEAFAHPLIAAFAVPAWRELCIGPAPGTKDFGTFYAQQREAFGVPIWKHQRFDDGTAEWVGTP